jgi:hypothetical protein
MVKLINAAPALLYFEFSTYHEFKFKNIIITVRANHIFTDSNYYNSIVIIKLDINNCEINDSNTISEKLEQIKKIHCLEIHNKLCIYFNDINPYDILNKYLFKTSIIFPINNNELYPELVLLNTYTTKEFCEYYRLPYTPKSDISYILMVNLIISDLNSKQFNCNLRLTLNSDFELETAKILCDINEIDVSNDFLNQIINFEYHSAITEHIDEKFTLLKNFIDNYVYTHALKQNEYYIC